MHAIAPHATVRILGTTCSPFSNRAFRQLNRALGSKHFRYRLAPFRSDERDASGPAGQVKPRRARWSRRPTVSTFCGSFQNRARFKARQEYLMVQPWMRHHTSPQSCFCFGRAPRTAIPSTLSCHSVRRQAKTMFLRIDRSAIPSLPRTPKTFSLGWPKRITKKHNTSSVVEMAPSFRCALARNRSAHQQESRKRQADMDDMRMKRGATTNVTTVKGKIWMCLEPCRCMSNEQLCNTKRVQEVALRTLHE